MFSKQSPRNLSDNVLLSRLHKLVTHEKQTTLSILEHLAEVDRRELYLSYGFSSLFDYCVGDLGYSRSAAGRRIASARCIRRYSEVLGLLESDKVNLCTVSLVAPILNDENKNLLLREICGKTKQQVESIVARFKPPIAYRDRVRPVRVAVPQSRKNTQNRRNPLILNSHCGSSNRTNSGIVETGSKQSSGPDPPGSDGPSVKVEKRLLIQFLASEEFMAKLEEVKSLLSTKIPKGSFEDVFEAVLDEFIDRHSPEKREERRERRRGSCHRFPRACSLRLRRLEDCGTRAPRSSRSALASLRRGGGPIGATRATDQAQTEKSDGDNGTGSRYIPVKTRDAVFKRDDGKCTYVGKNGRRCGSTHNLQIDHIKPLARGGKNTLSNLRLLCGKHNRLEAKRILGAAVMNQYIRRE